MCLGGISCVCMCTQPLSPKTQNPGRLPKIREINRMVKRLLHMILGSGIAMVLKNASETR